jgi:hypothetical protein
MIKDIEEAIHGHYAKRLTILSACTKIFLRAKIA